MLTIEVSQRRAVPGETIRPKNGRSNGGTVFMGVLVGIIWMRE
jgi:hypothetical protein